MFISKSLELKRCIGENSNQIALKKNSVSQFSSVIIGITLI